MATKQDLGEVRQEVAELRHEMALLRMEVKQETATLGTELRHEIAASHSETKVQVADVKASIAETKVWSVGVGTTIIAVPAAMKYAG